MLCVGVGVTEALADAVALIERAVELLGVAVLVTIAVSVVLAEGEPDPVWDAATLALHERVRVIVAVADIVKVPDNVTDAVTDTE